MNYVVDWSPDAINALAIVWMRTTRKPEITQGQAAIDRLLATDPNGRGTPLSEGLFSLEVYPLRVLYEIDSGKKTVRVVSASEVP